MRCSGRVVAAVPRLRKPLSAVDPLAQERVIRLACASASMTPAALTAVELHGTGTPLGDPVEAAQMRSVG